MAPSNYSDADFTKSTAITHWVMAIGLAGAAVWVSTLLSWPWIFDLNHPDFNPMVALPILLGIVSGVQLFKALRWTSRQRKFGTATMELKGNGSVRLGGRLEGKVRTATTLRPEGDFSVVLQCVETHQFRELRDPAQRAHKDEQLTVWKQELVVAAQGLDSAQGIPFRFQLPDSVGEAAKARSPVSAGSPYFRFKGAIMIPGMRRIWTHNAPPALRTWQLDVTAPMPGTDFHAQFVVPVQQD